MNSCPHCKQNDQGFIRYCQITGSVQEYYDGNGKYDGVDYDKTYHRDKSKVIRCANCHKIRRDVIFNETELGIVDAQIK